jgi:hypothetical protein
MKMNCENVQNLLPRFVAGDMPREGLRVIEAHLARCPACRRERELLVASWDMLGAYEVPQVSRDFTASLMHRIHGESGEADSRDAAAPPARVRRLRRLPWAVAAGLAAVVGLGVLWVRNSADRGPGPVTPIGQRAGARVVSDEELIRDLDVYENIELLEKLEFLSDLEVIEEAGDLS